MSTTLPHLAKPGFPRTMSTPPGCCLAREVTRRRTRIPWAALLPGFALALLPKCPLCIAVYLSIAGVSAGVAVPLARAAHPLCAIAAVLGLGLALVIVRLVIERARPGRAG